MEIKTGNEAMLPQGVAVGNAQDDASKTGCTAIICPKGAMGGVTVYGGAPATRETDLLKSENSVQAINAVVLSGGSAFGLDASTGVMRYLEEQHVGFEFGNSTVPIVCAASLFDLAYGDGSVRPDAAMGYAAAANAYKALDKTADSAAMETGNVGAGAGATVGKLLGPEHAMESGLGAASIEQAVGDDTLLVCAIVAVNALGNVYDRSCGTYVAGAQIDGKVVDPYEAFTAAAAAIGEGTTDSAGTSGPTTNTTIGCIATNAMLSKPQANKIASMAHDGYGRAIEPVHTSNDGDAIFCMATGSVTAHPDLVGALAARAMEAAILNAVA
jgi:L-aminopeptidase/D-esterase-like protein